MGGDLAHTLTDLARRDIARSDDRDPYLRAAGAPEDDALKTRAVPPVRRAG
jgi:hypothetical protein